jgi:hypothetical protein
MSMSPMPSKDLNGSIISDGEIEPPYGPFPEVEKRSVLFHHERSRATPKPESGGSPCDPPPRPKKKLPKRTGQKLATATPFVSVHPTLWDAHGNDIVTVQMDDVQFRLHSSWLAKHSAFFSRLLKGENLGDGAHVEKREGGDSIYHVSAAAVDFKALLSAMDNAMYVLLLPTLRIIHAYVSIATSMSPLRLFSQLLRFYVPRRPLNSSTSAGGPLRTSNECGPRICMT